MKKDKKISLTKSILKILEKTPKIASDLALDYIYIFDRPYSLFHRLLEQIDPNISRHKFYATYHRLKRQGLIGISEKNGVTTIHLTEAGKEKLIKYKLDELKIKKPEKWDGKWRIIVFDIPEKRKLARDVLRQKFRELGLFRIQDSVWIHPYDISDLIEFLSRIYEIKPFVKLIIAESINEDWKIRQKFNL
jgi:DNA-binding transcriptional regulator PaaX